MEEMGFANPQAGSRAEGETIAMLRAMSIVTIVWAAISCAAPASAQVERDIERDRARVRLRELEREQDRERRAKQNPLRALADAVEFRERAVYEVVGVKEREWFQHQKRFESSVEHRPNLLLSVRDTLTGGTRDVVVLEGGEAPFWKKVAQAREGELFSMTTITDRAAEYVTTIDIYEARAGESKPGVYVFVDQRQEKIDGQAFTVIRVFKLGRAGKVIVPNITDAKGKVVPDPALMETIKKFNRADMIEAATTGGETPMLKTIEPYARPVVAKVTKLTDAKVDGGLTPAIEADLDGKAVTLLTPGRLDVNKKWQADAPMRLALRKLKPGDRVMVRFSDGEQKWIKEIERAPEGE